jgi:hypothetical protein
MRKLSRLIAIVVVAAGFSGAARAQQLIDVEAKIKALVAAAVEQQLRSQLGVSLHDAPHSDIKYDDSKVTNQVSGDPTMTFSESGLPDPTQVFVGCCFACNDTDAVKSELTIDYSNDDSVSQRSEWSIGLTLSEGFEFSDEVDFEGLGSIGEKVSMGIELSTNFTQGKEQSHSIAWSSGFKVDTPPHTSLQAIMVVQKVSFKSTSFSLDTVLAGGANIPNVSYKFTDKNGKTVSSGKMDQLAFQIEDAYPNVADRTIHAEGKFSGDQWGTSASYFTFNEQPAPAGTCSPDMPVPACGSSMPANSKLAGTNSVSIPKI